MLLNSNICVISDAISDEVCSKHPRSCVVSLLSLNKILAIFYPFALAKICNDLISLGGSSVVIRIGILHLIKSQNA